MEIDLTRNVLPAPPEVPISPIRVLAKSDFPPNWTAISLDNSVFARMNSPLNETMNQELSPIQRILEILVSSELRSQLNIHFMVSQALHYDRIRDNSGEESFVRHIVPAFTASVAPSHLDDYGEWPVAKTDAVDRLPNPISTDIVEQDGLTFSRRFTPISRALPSQSTLAKESGRIEATVYIPLCVYEPGWPEDQAARAFNFNNFEECDSRRKADICHVASHLRFAPPGSILLSNDHHFNHERLRMIGVTCMAPDAWVRSL